MDAKTLYQQGVTAIRDEKDSARGRALLMQSLRLEPKNDMAWLWLSRTVSDPVKKLQCAERALEINPANEGARGLKAKLNGATVESNARLSASPETSPRRESDALRIAALMERAEQHLQDEQIEAAIEQWVRVLEIEVDHEEAMARAVRHLSRQKYIGDARELVWNALESGTQHPSIYLTAIDIARYQRHHDEVDELRERLAKLPTANEKLISDIVDEFIANDRVAQAESILVHALSRFPKSQKLLLKRAELLKEGGRQAEALRIYEQTAHLGASTKEGKLADEKLLQYSPRLTDRERGSTILAVREALGFGVAFVLMGWQDAGLDLLRLGPGRWAGVALSVIGGYLVVTATSSPQQQPLARWLGGQVPEPPETPKASYEAAINEPVAPTELTIIPPALRLFLGAIGLGLLLLASWLVFRSAIGLIGQAQPAPFYVPSPTEIFTE